MNVLFKKVKLHFPGAEHHGQVVDIHLLEGRLAGIGELSVPEALLIEAEGLTAVPGLFDMCCVSSDPGHEHTDDLATISLAAARGGYSAIALLPNTQPVVQNKASVAYIQRHSGRYGVQLHTLAAVTRDTEGKDFTEMLDLHHAGAVGFTDGVRPLWNADLLLKALQYLAPVGKLLINRPEDRDLALFGQMHEGEMSTRLGLKGIPSAAEEIMITRDLALLRYADRISTQPVLHFSQISSAGSVELVREAKASGLPVSCDVAAHQLLFTDEDLGTFDTNLKVSPPFRTAADREALRAGLADGTIDAIVSGHRPLEEELKKVEFDLAEFGILGLQTAFATALQHSGLSLEQVVEKMSLNPRKLLNLEQPTCRVGEAAHFAFVQPNEKWVFTDNLNASKSNNSPFLGKELIGKVISSF